MPQPSILNATSRVRFTAILCHVVPKAKLEKGAKVCKIESERDRSRRRKRWDSFLLNSNPVCCKAGTLLVFTL